jgi:GNAT superfamily N-acetyltransferase
MAGASSTGPRVSGDSIHVRRAIPGDEDVVRTLRLAALADSPDAFASTLDLEVAWSLSDWQEWISRGATFIAEDSNGPKGIVAGEPNWDDPGSAFLIAMWVHPVLRGTGTADKLVACVLSWARAEGASGVWLHVDKGGDRARRCYERNGFHATGREIVRRREGLLIEMFHPLDGAER